MCIRKQRFTIQWYKFGSTIIRIYQFRFNTKEDNTKTTIKMKTIVLISAIAILVLAVLSRSQGQKPPLNIVVSAMVADINVKADETGAVDRKNLLKAETFCQVLLFTGDKCSEANVKAISALKDRVAKEDADVEVEVEV